MTIKILGQYGQVPANSLLTLDSVTEAALVASGQASFNLQGGVVWSPPGNSPGSWVDAFTAAQAAALTSVIVKPYPEVPTAVVAVASEASALVYFSPSLRALYYVVTASNGVTASGATSPITVSGLSNGQSYTFTITAIGAGGLTATSGTTNAVTPTALPAGMSGIKGLIAWWDASQLAPQSDNTAVTSWPDSSGNGYTGTPPTSKPVYRTAANHSGGATGKPGISFDGVAANQQRFDTTLTTNAIGPEATIFVVGSKASSLNGASLRDQRLLSGEATAADRGLCIQLSDNNNGGGSDVIAARWASPEINSSSAITLNTLFVYSVVTGAQAFLNGTRQAPQAFCIPQIIGRSQPITLGNIKGGVGNHGLQGIICEQQIWRGRLSDASRQSIEAYLCTKYAQTAPAVQATL